MPERTGPSRLKLLILRALQPRISHHVGGRPVARQDRPIKHVYQGTVARADVQRRRAKNKAARRSRRVNRLRAR